MADVLQRVADGKIKRLMVFMPPRHGKSEMASRTFPAYYLHKHPRSHVGINSYAAELAYGFSRNARDNYSRCNGLLNLDATAVKEWHTASGGMLWAAGVGGPITGRGFFCGIIDDPLKNYAEAASTKVRENQKQWYQSTFSTREEPSGSIVLSMTRWNTDDLAGWLLKTEELEPQGWHIVNFEAIKSKDAISIPSTCTLEPDWREIGEALCPERYDVDKLLKISKRVGSYFWSSLYQQTPTPAEGGLFKRKWWRRWDKVNLPYRFDNMCISVDAAFKGNIDSDYVVIQAWGKKGSKFYLLDQIRDRMGITATEIAIITMINRWPDARARVIEDKANGPAIIERLSRMTAGIIAWNPGSDSKLSRTTAIVPLVEAQNILLPPDADWVDGLIEEFAVFPNGANDDQCDAMTIAIAYLEEKTYDLEWLKNL